MKIKITMALLVMMSGYILYAQAPDKKNEDDSAKAGETIPLKGGSLYDERFGLEKFSFYKKYASSGKGEILEMYFDIVNHTDQKVNLKMYVFSVCEKDKVTPQRDYKGGYPNWRKRDFERESIIIRNFYSIPELDKEKVKEWAIDTRIELNNQREEKEKLSMNKETMMKSYDVDLIDYISFAEKNIENGVDVLLRGSEESQETAKTSIGGDNYQMFQNPRKTTIIAHMFSKFRKDYSFFNRIGVILYDVDQKKVVYRQFFVINPNMKIR